MFHFFFNFIFFSSDGGKVMDMVTVYDVTNKFIGKTSFKSPPNTRNISLQYHPHNT